MQPLKLVALDAEDLGIISAQLQDAVMRLDDIAYLPKERRFAMVLNRFDWPKALAGEKAAEAAKERRRSAIRFENVKSVRRQNIAQSDPDRVFSLLAITFAPADPPAGFITLVFAGGGAIRLEVDCIETELRDLGAAWTAVSKPDHEGEATEAAKRTGRS